MNHNDVQTLLAWSVNGSLDNDEQAAVAEHSLGCETCRDELASTWLLADVCREPQADEPAFDPGLIDRAIAQLPAIEQLARDEAAIEPVPEAPAKSSVVPFLERLQRRVRWQETPGFARFAIAAQVALVVGLAALVGLRTGDAPSSDAIYDTVAGPTAVADATVVWREDADSGEVANLLRAVNAEVVGGPNTLGMYRLRFVGDASFADRLTALKDSELVLYAELAAK